MPGLAEAPVTDPSESILLSQEFHAWCCRIGFRVLYNPIPHRMCYILTVTTSSVEEAQMPFSGTKWTEELIAGGGEKPS